MNLEIWDKVKQPPKTALKTIAKGRLAGKSDINPQWRIQALTELFGPCGTGWKYEITRLWTEPGSDGQIISNALVTLFYKKDGEWSEPIQGIGGNKTVTKESSGLYTNDEGYKMAVTDAIGVAAKCLGIAADIYLGNFDGSKYATEHEEQRPPKAVESKIMAVRNCHVPEELESYLAELAKNHQKGKAFDPELVKEIQKRKKELGVTKTFKEA